MIHVRRHERQVRPGKTVNVRAHEREGSDLTAAPEWARPAQASDFRQEPEPDAGEWWDDDANDAATSDFYAAVDSGDEGAMDDAAHRMGTTRRRDVEPALVNMKEEMRRWRKVPEPTPSPDEPMSPQMAKLLGADTPEGLARYERGRAYREAGYDGPLNSDNRIPDPDDPAEQESLSALAAMSRL